MLGRSCAFLLIPLIALGCASESSPPASSMQIWVHQQGGIVQDARQARVDAAARPLLAHCQGRTVTIQVFAMDQLCAYGWPSGNIFISRGLVDHLTNQELSATVAHELGHLLSDGRLHSTVSLRGYPSSYDREVRADAAGIGLLQASGIPPHAMVTMLRKVADSVDLPQVKLAIDHRIAILNSEIKSTDPVVYQR